MPPAHAIALWAAAGPFHGPWAWTMGDGEHEYAKMQFLGFKKYKYVISTLGACQGPYFLYTLIRHRRIRRAAGREVA
ncbi:hypothetical protein JCM14469_23260 [Desulfatiferula olefinivorans]